ncbi:porin [Aquitalea sp. USM4]|uniref:porin n=1 Tax=Aquitalea sp. USM4 TaxID=1590041 RepID=UPI00103E2ACE|nr:porin [Aquitalea sp. USM4]QBJ77410.1 porin [Aquitalea sp. USM4]
MNKKLIALALAALPVAHAMADVTIYGTIEADVESNKTYANGVKDVNGKPKAVSRIDDTGSLIGFKGNEDLGNGLKAIWQVEQGLSIDGTTVNASNTFATRDSFVGLQGAFGKVRIGKLSTFLNSDAGAPDAWIYGNKGVNGQSYSSINQLDGRVNNAIRYDIPEFVAGLSGAVVYGVDETNATNKQNTFSFGTTYTNSGYFGTFGYQRFNNNIAGNKAGNYWRLEAGYNANNILAAAYYGQSKLASGTTDATFGFASTTDLPNGSELKKKEAGLTLGYTFGAITPKFSYGRVWGASVDGTDVKGHLNQYVLGADYALSKRTTAYASYGYVQNTYRDSNDNKFSNERTVAVGVQHKF